jgi:hypothetical protein
MRAECNSKNKLVGTLASLLDKGLQGQAWTSGDIVSSSTLLHIIDVEFAAPL